MPNSVISLVGLPTFLSFYFKVQPVVFPRVPPSFLLGLLLDDDVSPGTTCVNFFFSTSSRPSIGCFLSFVNVSCDSHHGPSESPLDLEFVTVP